MTGKSNEEVPVTTTSHLLKNSSSSTPLFTEKVNKCQNCHSNSIKFFVAVMLIVLVTIVANVNNSKSNNANNKKQQDHAAALKMSPYSPFDREDIYGSNHVVGGSIGSSGVLVTGATGRTGSLLYFNLKSRGVSNVRAFVRSVDTAREVLGCDKCNADEGIYVGDVTNLNDLMEATKGVSSVAIAVGASPRNTPEEQKAIEFDGVQNTVAALAQKENLQMFGSSKKLHVVLCSSMGTTSPQVPNWSGDILFWKLNAEVFLGSAGIGSTVIKPCGLTNNKGGHATLLAGHDDKIHVKPPAIPREDVAAVMAEAIISESDGLRFDLCSKAGPATTDLKAFLDSARWYWEKNTAARD